MGRRAFFIRTIGCPVQCPWCDSAGTWHPDWKPEKKNLMSVSQLVEEALVGEPAIVVVTGGEPTIFDLTPLCAAMYDAGLPIHLETSGAFPIKGRFDWITVSPKKWKLPILDATLMASEFKIIVEKPSDIEYYLNLITVALQHNQIKGYRPIVWLHPEWSQHNNPEVLNAISDFVTTHKLPWPIRAGYQMHKLYKVDALDKRSAKLVPLGGDVNRGY